MPPAVVDSTAIQQDDGSLEWYDYQKIAELAEKSDPTLSGYAKDSPRELRAEQFSEWIESNGQTESSTVKFLYGSDQDRKDTVSIWFKDSPSKISGSARSRRQELISQGWSEKDASWQAFREEYGYYNRSVQAHGLPYVSVVGIAGDQDYYRRTNGVDRLAATPEPEAGTSVQSAGQPGSGVETFSKLSARKRQQLIDSLGLLPDGPTQQMYRALDAGKGDTAMVVRDAEGNPAGVATFDTYKGDWTLKELYIHPDAQRSGIGQKIMADAAYQMFAKNRSINYPPRFSVMPALEESRPFYQKLGAEFTDRGRGQTGFWSPQAAWDLAMRSGKDMSQFKVPKQVNPAQAGEVAA